jgi:hypothetical protein
LWSLRFYIIKKLSFAKDIHDNFMALYHSLNKRDKMLVLIVFIVMFLCMELCLRMVFEAMIGYFDMHDYLYKISQKIHK